jgi:hypothetical protein
MSNEKCLIQNQDRKMVCIRCARQDLDCRYAHPSTSVYPTKNLAYGYGTNTSYQHPYASDYTNKADIFTFYGGEPYEHCGDGRCICRAAGPILEHSMESYISGIIDENHVREKGDVWMIVNLTDEQFRETGPSEYMRGQ